MVTGHTAEQPRETSAPIQDSSARDPGRAWTSSFEPSQPKSISARICTGWPKSVTLPRAFLICAQLKLKSAQDIRDISGKPHMFMMLAWHGEHSQDNKCWMRCASGCQACITQFASRASELDAPLAALTKHRKENSPRWRQTGLHGKRQK